MTANTDTYIDPETGEHLTAAQWAGRRDRGKHNCDSHAGYNLRHEHVCLRCGKPIQP